MKLLPQNPLHCQLSPDWKYVRSDKTDVRKTFKKQRDLIALQNAKPSKVRELKRMMK
jgi:hypothetical protein